MAITDGLVLSFCGAVGWAVWHLMSPRLPALIDWPVAVVAFLLASSAFLGQAIPWWRRALLRR